MYQFSYADIQTDSVADAKDRERQLLTRSIDLLAPPAPTAAIRWKRSRRSISSTGSGPPSSRISAARENALPKELRANLISIGLWLLREAEDVRQGRSEQFRGPDRSLPDHPRRHPMKNTLKISLKPNEKIYINGAVIRVDRKVTIELLNDVQFLLESHVMQAERGVDAAAPALFHPAGHADEPERRARGARHVPPLAAAAAGELRATSRSAAR